MAAAPERFDAIDIQEAPEGFPDLADLNGLLDLWREKAGGSGPPSRADFKPAELLPWMGHVSLLDVTEDPRRFRWRLIGSRIVEWTGRDRTGQWLEEIYAGPSLDAFMRLYEKVVAQGVPLFFSGTLLFVGKQHVRFRVVVMPLSDDGARVNMLMLCLHFDS
ncbi:PAS domain-containing protein [Marinibaculum pumilum]|uniref:PAS domain-containing protein n=1 Tax=Marinibaculum pumilum TaxID=1766165 RepID=A0ABV7L393_9PROT